MKQENREKWQSFTSLGWYDGLIEFIFRFVAKTSEPLLAAGLVVSAADYLSHGAVMAGHPGFSLAWAWAQALALESSSGVVFVYALQAFRQADKVKGIIYLVLAFLLAIVGGAMLLMQVNAVTLGSAEGANIVINFLRVVVSIAYIFLLRAKSIRFSDLADTREQPAQVPDVDRIVDAIVARAIERVNVAIETPVQPALPAPEAKSEQADSVSDARVEQVRAILEETPEASVRDVARAIGRSKSTAHKAVKAVKEQKERRTN